MNTSYLKEISSEARRLGDKLKALTEDKDYHTNIVCSAPISEAKLIEIDLEMKMLEEKRDILVEQAKQARLQLAVAQGEIALVVTKSGGMK